MDLDLEDKEDIESRLYAQIHHESGEADLCEFVVPPQVVRLVKQCKINNYTHSAGGKRYWNKNSFSGNRDSRQKSVNKFSKSMEEKEPQNELRENIPVKGINKPFRPYVPYMTNVTNSGVVPNASGDGPEAKGSVDKEEIKPKLHSSKDKMHTNPFSRNISHLNKALRLEEKKNKARQARQKIKISNVETIVLDSSDEDMDVVLIPTDPPPLVTIDSSDCSDIDVEKMDSDSFIKPRAVSNKQAQSSSKCASPNSVLSDDFIGQSDRSRLNIPDIADDLELQCILPTVDSFIKKTTENIPNQSGTENYVSQFISPARRTKKNKKSEESYQVTQTNFKAIDVYESESSDMPENVYAKNKAPVIEHKTISSSDIEGIDVMVSKTKRLRKRKASGSNKSSEFNDNSSDSEYNDFELSNKDKTCSISFIVRGEAVENNRANLKKRSKSKRIEVNCSDNEFFDMLSNIVHGKDLANDSENSSDEDITARKIAEDVLNKAKDCSELELHSDKSDNEEALPDSAMVTLNRVLEDIEMNTAKEIPSPICASPDPNCNKDENQKEDKNEAYAVVRSNATHIGWNQEMIRFYDYSWGDEKFNTFQIRKLMNPLDKWSIYTQDRFPKGRFPKLKCHNCREHGHVKAKCPRPKRDLTCYMCGDVGHSEPRCPNTICLGCGRKTQFFTSKCNHCKSYIKKSCAVCKVPGHNFDACPDKWRRYHSTTIPNEKPDEKVIYNKRKFCCICAGRGHLAEDCRSALKFLDYPVPASDIKSHSIAYEDNLNVDISDNGPSYNLFYEPNDNIRFPITTKVTKKQCYGRFLSAVGLDEIIAYQKSQSLIVEAEMKKRNYVLNPFANNTEERDVPEQNIFAGFIYSKKKQQEKANTSFQNFSFIREIENLKHNTKIELNLSRNKKGPNKFVSPKPLVYLESFLSNQKIDDKSCETNELIKNSSNISVQDDNDSNYNFTEHFGDTGTAEKDQLPDYIPLEESNDEELENSAVIGISQKYVAHLDENVDEPTQNDPAICQAKIFLTNFHSKILLSPDGNTFLVDHSKKYDVKASIDWTSVGNILIIEGIPHNQDNFHQDLLIYFRKISDDVKRNELEKSQKVPRKKDSLVRFLQEQILQLENDLGNVSELYKRMKYHQNETTKSSWKIAEKNRRILNMILVGQTGLNEGKVHLDALLTHLKKMQESVIGDVVPNEMRDEVDTHWRYIFSSQIHENYEQMVQEYSSMKHSNQLPKLYLDYKLLGRKVLDVSLTKEQKDKLDKCKVTDMVGTVRTDNSPNKIYDRTLKNPKKEKPNLVLNPMSLQRVKYRSSPKKEMK